ncbi:hypothetical protein DPMN_099244 [Dreissena polymorpha]|uniref:Uncharacterized protein n=1 Tax=Dreissena polymorpha TaxID=45954 RepID=A0A9D4R7G7_DREPO|nr:hypothetical protein DPMN_099244 [Dreissena polymorpha]
MYEALRPSIELAERKLSFAAMKPKYGYINSNFCQAVEFLFTMHPLYRQHINSLEVKTELIDGGKCRLSNTVPNRKRKFAANPKDKSRLSKKMLGQTEEKQLTELLGHVQKTVTDSFPEQKTISMPDLQMVKEEIVETTSPEEPVQENQTSNEPCKLYFITESGNDEQENLLSQAVRTRIPNIHVQPHFRTFCVQKDLLTNGLVLYIPETFGL